jgi:murein DD-endopeptidase MepM/ murein hydrolase activator NlpD
VERFDFFRRPAWRQPLRQNAAAKAGAQQAQIVVFFWLVFLFPLAAHALPWTVRSQPTRLLNGAPVLFEVRPPEKLNSLTGKWEGHDLIFSYNALTRTWFVLAGVGFATSQGKYPLELTGESAKRESPVRFTHMFAVFRANYPKIRVPLAVEKKYTEPSPEQQTQIADSVKVKQEYLSRISPDREWDGDFAAPVNAPTSDVYGSQRIFNGVAQREHQGLDYRVPTGTPVAAMNDGTVLLARFLYFEGNCVVIDHGQGLLTLYFHLSELKVKEGDSVKRGQEIGLSGGTGRATGPHLHVAVRWQGTYLDPARLLQLRLP